MKQLRLLLLMLVALVAQVSYGQDLLETWYEEGLIREKMIPVMLFSNGKNLADYQKQFEDIAQSLSGVHKYGSGEIYSVKQKEEYIQRHIDSVKGNLSKWQKKLEKGKSLDFKDALWGALVSQYDDAMAAKFFDAAAKVAKDDSTKTILQLAAIGCKYSANKDKAAAAAAINFPIPDNCKSAATLIVNKYSLKDIPSETIQQISYGQNSGKSAEEVWEDFLATPSDMYILLDRLADSDDPQEYKSYISNFVPICLKNGVSWDTLFDEMKEKVLPKDSSVASIFCAYLVHETKDLSKKSKVMQVMPKSCRMGDNTYLKSNIKMISGGMLLEIDAEVSLSYEELYKMNNVIAEKNHMRYVDNYKHNLLCLPDGTMKFGDFKEDNPLELYIGYTLDDQGKIIGETCMGYDSFDKALNSLKKAEAAKEKAIGDIYQKQWAQMKAKLVKQYGTKAFNAMNQGRPYVGMPEGIIRDFGTPYPDNTGNRSNDKFVHAYTFSHTDIGGFKIYQSVELFVYMGAPKQPTYVYCKGGRVAAIKW